MMSKRENEKNEPKIAKLSIADFAREIGLQPDKDGRVTFGPEHNRLAYEYAEKFARENKAEKIVIDGVASPGVIASLLHGAHPAEGHLTYMQRDKEGSTTKSEIEVLEPLPLGDGSGPEYLTWVKKETDEYTLIEFNLSGDFKPEDLDEVIPPEVDPTKPALISGRGPLYLTHTIAAGYRHYKGTPAVGFYQPASKFGPAKTEVGISHNENLPSGLNFGEPSEIGAAKEQYENRILEKLNELEEGINNKKIVSAEVERKTLTVTSDAGKVYRISVREIM